VTIFARFLEAEAEKTISVVFDTPGSTVNRRWTGEGQYSVGQSPKILLDVQSPFNKFNLQCKAHYNKSCCNFWMGIDLSKYLL
jgi:hypothetical protein